MAVVYIIPALSLAVLIIWQFFRRRSSLPLPPGPPGYPIIGNIKDLPPKDVEQWRHWWDFRRYGRISSITILGQTLVILNEPEPAFDLLDRRSARHSSRPQAPFLQLAGWDEFAVSAPDNETHKAHRKNLRSILGSKARVRAMVPALEEEIQQVMLKILDEPRLFMRELSQQAMALMLKLAYGYDTHGEATGFNDLPELGRQMVHDFEEAFAPEGWLVDRIPLLAYLPSWLPGMGFKKAAQRFRNNLDRLSAQGLAYVEGQNAKGGSNPSYLSTLLNNEKLSRKDAHIAERSTISFVGGGSDTTISTFQFFLLAMLQFPEVQRKAHEELDSVTGSDRLPTIDDIDSLPYVNALIKESFRWQTVAPMGVPHMTTQDDEYDGFLIPKGALLFPNMAGWTHDPERYPEPLEFKPERFLGDKPNEDPLRMVFGFGRRICPGRELSIVWAQLTIARLLTVFRFERPRDMNGKLTTPKMKVIPGIVSHPEPFQIVALPRSERAKGLVVDE